MWKPNGELIQVDQVIKIRTKNRQYAHNMSDFCDQNCGMYNITIKGLGCKTHIKLLILHQPDPLKTATRYFLLKKTTKLITFRKAEFHCTHNKAEPWKINHMIQVEQIYIFYLNCWCIPQKKMLWDYRYTYINHYLHEHWHTADDRPKTW